MFRDTAGPSSCRVLFSLRPGSEQQYVLLDGNIWPLRGAGPKPRHLLLEPVTTTITPTALPYVAQVCAAIAVVRIRTMS